MDCYWYATSDYTVKSKVKGDKYVQGYFDEDDYTKVSEWRVTSILLFQMYE